jgi:hypothetical protein
MVRKDCMLAWETYDKRVRNSSGCSSDTVIDREKIVQGELLLSDAAGIVGRAKRVAFSSQLTSPGFVTHQFTAGQEKDIRASSHFRLIAGPLADLLSTCIAELRAPIAAALGTPWRILNVRAWTTPPAVKAALMYGFHCDGYPDQIFKAMIYFTPMDNAHGALEIDGRGMITGPAGSWVLFFNSLLMHRGLPGAKEERAAAEITLARSREFDLDLRQPGINAHWPFYP